MANAVYVTEEVELQDETTVLLKPLPIAGLRAFMDMIKEFDSIQDTDQGFNILVSAAAFCLCKKRPEFWDSKERKATEAFEEAVDMPTVHKILDVCGGVNFNDPNLLAAAKAALGQNQTQ